MRAMEECPDCGLRLPEVATGTHAYLGASPSCWALYGEVLAREYGDPRNFRAHRMTVDAYAAQHPGRPERRTTQSINVHLASLHLLLDRGASAEAARRAIAALAERHAAAFRWLDPPACLGSVRVDSVAAAGDAEEHGCAADRWARSVWSAWAAHHGHVVALVARLGW